VLGSVLWMEGVGLGLTLVRIIERFTGENGRANCPRVHD